MKFEATGTLKLVGETEQVTDTFKKREVWLEVPGDYPQTIPIEFVQGNVERLDNFKVGDSVTVSVDVRGRLYTSKKSGETGCFSKLNGWRITPAAEAKAEADAVGVTFSADDELPF